MSAPAIVHLDARQRRCARCLAHAPHDGHAAWGHVCAPRCPGCGKPRDDHDGRAAVLPCTMSVAEVDLVLDARAGAADREVLRAMSRERTGETPPPARPGTVYSDRWEVDP